jgi:hypothetical protein
MNLYAMKTGGRGGTIPPFFISAPDGGERLASRPWLEPPFRSGQLAGGCREETKLPHQGIEPEPSIPTELSKLFMYRLEWV